jgi:hypothetical protein
MYTGYVYQIVADDTDKVYFGSTVTSLKKRFKGHKCLLDNKCSSKELFNYPNARIELIETCVNDDKKLLIGELKDIEAEYITRCREIKPNKCVNQQMPNGIDSNKRKEYLKIYNQTEKRKQYLKEYGQKNKEKILQQNKLNLRKYRLNNPEQFKEYEKKRVRNKKPTGPNVQA